MEEEIKWLAGSIMGVVAMVGGFLARDRQVMARIEAGDDDVMRKVDALQTDLGIVKRDYVRRDDMKEHIQAMERIVALGREEQKALSARVDTLINMLTQYQAPSRNGGRNETR